MSPINALLEAIVQRLLADEALQTLIPMDLLATKEKDMRLYQYVPEEAVSPYIYIADPMITTVYVAPEEVVDVRMTLHIWHNQAETGDYGIGVIASCLEAVKQALRFKLYPTKHNVLNVTKNEERIMDDVNPDVKHAVFTLTYKLEKQ